MKETPQQIELPGVPKAKQGREVALQWAWTEAGVWTERMLATLERGNTGGKWSTLAQGLLRRTRIDLLSLNPSPSGQCSCPSPLTGEPDASKSPVRFGGRGSVQSALPTPILAYAARIELEAALARTGTREFEFDAAKRCCANQLSGLPCQT